jgi:hypothetical protein
MRDFDKDIEESKKAEYRQRRIRIINETLHPLHYKDVAFEGSHRNDIEVEFEGGKKAIIECKDHGKSSVTFWNKTWENHEFVALEDKNNCNPNLGTITEGWTAYCDKFDYILWIWHHLCSSYRDIYILVDAKKLQKFWTNNRETLPFKMNDETNGKWQSSWRPVPISTLEKAGIVLAEERYDPKAKYDLPFFFNAFDIIQKGVKDGNGTEAY